ncbi:acyl-CoA dehydrogenase family protein [bacterium 210820-DFI.6.37]|nr:acyl-CoA dehydrogenase family protein [bacterium 210820-DFI.6.37]
MSLMYTREQSAMIQLVQKMMENEVKPYVPEADKTGKCPRELYRYAFQMGLHMAEIPKEYGGVGLSYESAAVIFEEVAKVDAGYALGLVCTFVALRNVILAGTKEQAAYFAERIKEGGFACFALTEAGAGSDPAAMRATAEYDPETNEYILNAQKTFITNGAWADIYVVFARTDTAAGSRGISAFLVEREAPGKIVIGREEDKMGLRLSNTVDVTFRNVRVPADRRIGKEGDGFKLAMRALNLSRPFLAVLAVGIMQRALDESMRYAMNRSQFDHPIIDFQMVQQMLADMAIRLETSRCLVNNTMRMMDAGVDVQKDGAITKTFVTDAGQKVVADAVQIFGGYGYNRDYPVEKLMRDMKAFQITEGTNQIQRMTIASCLKQEYGKGGKRR